MTIDANAPFFLIGPRACGKSTLAQVLAKRLHWAVADTDLWLTAQSGQTVAELVAAKGWDAFRQREAAALRALALPRTVIATGGGMVLLAENRVFMRETGRVIYLDAPLELLHKRLTASPLTAQRPSLTGRGLVEEMEEILKTRSPLYLETAHHRMDAGMSAGLLAEKLERLLETA